jgi:hypothetical protein
MPFVENHSYSGCRVLGDVFNITAAASFLGKVARIFATSSQICEASDYAPSHLTVLTISSLIVDMQYNSMWQCITTRSLWQQHYLISSQHSCGKVCSILPPCIWVLYLSYQLEIAAIARRYLGRKKPT